MEGTKTGNKKVFQLPNFAPKTVRAQNTTTASSAAEPSSQFKPSTSTVEELY